MNDEAQFEAWPKIGRLNRSTIITEKIDGTNAAVLIVAIPWGQGNFPDHHRTAIIVNDEERDDNGRPEFEYHVYAQSRTRFITPGKGTDNYGFAGWVERNAEALVSTLGIGRHFGEWWGGGIQRGYGLAREDKRFSLFNVERWANLTAMLSEIPGLGVVPAISVDAVFDTDSVTDSVDYLRDFGSLAARGFMNPEGVVVYHPHSRTSFKVTLEGDEAPKGIAGHALDVEKVAA